MNVVTKVLGGKQVAQRFALAAVTTGPKTRAVVVAYGQLLSTRVKAHASGRPGPNAPTGDYRRSINCKIAGTGEFTTAEVGTNRPQAARLEFGFVGRDSLGRHYSQPPYPHFGPAVTEIEPKFKAALLAVVAKI